jgi:transposase
MPVKNFLSQEQKQNLQQALRESEHPELRERVLMLLLMNEGKTYEQIASFLGCSQRTVAYWCVHGDADNLESLQDKRRIGSYRKATDEYVKILLEIVDIEPGELGDEFGRWTGERLALTGVGFLQLGGIRTVKSINRSRRKRTPTMKMNGNVVEEVSR